jgi:hypothetical protein
MTDGEKNAAGKLGGKLLGWWDGGGAEGWQRGTHLMGAMPGDGQCSRCLDNWGEGCEEGTAILAEGWAPTVGGVELEIPLHKLNRCGARPKTRAVNGDPNVLHCERRSSEPG